MLEEEIKDGKKDVYESHGDFSQEKISAKYDELASGYEDVYTSVGWPDPEKTAEFIIDLGLSEDSKVLDMGCGTGMVAQHMKTKSGLSRFNVDGIDASQGMLDLA